MIKVKPPETVLRRTLPPLYNSEVSAALRKVLDKEALGPLRCPVVPLKYKTLLLSSRLPISVEQGFRRLSEEG